MTLFYDMRKRKKTGYQPARVEEVKESISKMEEHEEKPEKKESKKPEQRRSKRYVKGNSKSNQPKRIEEDTFRL